MKPFIQKLPLAQQTSFVAKTFTTPHYETTWHQHKEVELIVQGKGSGMCFIGNYVGGFTEGDIYLFGPNLPHEFKKERKGMKCSVMVIHFDPEAWGDAFWNLPESAEIKRLLDGSLAGFKITSGQAPELAETIKRIERVHGFERFTLLCQCLLQLSRSKHKQRLSTLDAANFAPLADDRINRVFEYTITHFQEGIAVPTVAAVAAMSVSAFCRFFKRNTKKTYVEFVNEMRIGQACQSLLRTDKTVLQICYDCGFNTVANFNRQFLKIKGMKPSVYKKKFRV